MLGLRTASSDNAVGMDLSLSPGKRVVRRMRRTLDNPWPIGVSYLSDGAVSKGTSAAQWTDPAQNQGTVRYLRVRQYNTHRVLRTFISRPPTYHPHVYPYTFYHPHHLGFQIAVLFLSLLKSLEIYTLFLLGGTLVGTLSGPSSFLFSRMIGFLHHHTRPSTSFVFSHFANSKIYSDTKRTLFVLTIEKVELVQLVLLEKELWNSKAPWVSEFLETSKISIVRCMTYHLTTSSPGALGAGQPS